MGTRGEDIDHRPYGDVVTFSTSVQYHCFRKNTSVPQRTCRLGNLGPEADIYQCITAARPRNLAQHMPIQRYTRF